MSRMSGSDQFCSVLGLQVAGSGNDSRLAAARLRLGFPDFGRISNRNQVSDSRFGFSPIAENRFDEQRLVEVYSHRPPVKREVWEFDLGLTLKRFIMHCYCGSELLSRSSKAPTNIDSGGQLIPK